MHYLKKGFTVIELLVVIAIISVLTGIVLANITIYTNRAKNASIKGSLSDLYKNSVVYLTDNGTFTQWPDPVYPGFATAVSSIPNTSMTYYGDDKGYLATQPPTRWCLCVNLSTTADTPSNSTHCIDSTGYSKQTTNSCINNRCKMANFLLAPPSSSGFCND